jgi:6-phospho-3-hexuloisomerase
MRTKEQSVNYLEENFDIVDFAAPINNNFKPWLDELHKELLEQADKVKRITKGLLLADRMYTVAKGRSELMVEFSGIRFMHTGYTLHGAGDKYTPAIGNDPNYKDVLFFVSGSGETKAVIKAENTAKKKNVPIYGVSSNKDSEAVQIAGEENVIITKGKKIYPPGVESPPEYSIPVNFLQTKSEIKANYVGELLVNCVANMKDIKESDMKKRHSNTE